MRGLVKILVLLVVYFKIVIFFAVELKGGSGSHEGNVYATNPDTGTHGPVCDDNWDMNDVSFVRKQ